MKTQLSKLLESQVKTSTGADILSIDEINAESAATLHALNSREAGGWKTNIQKLFDSDGKIITRILKDYYVGYSHKSIGDCGPGHVFVDNLSMLAANALEHNALFSGQETSSRYVDVSEKGYVPTGDPRIDSWIEKWLDFYTRNLSLVFELLSKENPCPDDKNKITWNKALNSRACDIMGAFLPSGSRTNMSLQMNLRQFADFMHSLIYHPLPEVRETAETIIVTLSKTHPNSFSFKKRDITEDYKKAVAEFVFGGSRHLTPYLTPFDWSFHTDITDGNLNRFLPKELLDRKKYTELPREVADLGQIKINSLIDFRSFRDLHRHRSITFRMPLVTTFNGFEQWYLDMLPGAVRIEADQLLKEFNQFYLEYVVEDNQFLMQHAVPMGYRVPCNCTMNLDAAVYVTDLRSGLPVHPTARSWAIKLADEMDKSFPSLRLYTCREPDQFVPDRGKHDIVRKEKVS